MKKIKTINISTITAIVFLCLLSISSFYAGASWIKNKGGSGSLTQKADADTLIFATEKTNKPKLDFYVMSFCPYGNQMEDVLRPIFDLIGNKADITPHYIFDKITDISADCKLKTGDVTKCAQYVEAKYFTNITECKNVINKNFQECQNPKNYISSNGVFYSALHGRVEANQHVREMCAWKLATDKKQWWDFIDNVNQNCDSQNADTCWEEQAKKAGFDSNKITECFNKDGIQMIEEEIALTTKLNVSGSPTVYINDVQFPPEELYTKETAKVKIGKNIYGRDTIRLPETVKLALCSSFKKAPKECSTVIEAPKANAAAATDASCN